MKILLSAACVAGILVAVSARADVLVGSLDAHQQPGALSYGASPALGRAWIRLKHFPLSPNPKGRDVVEERFHVEGLTFDAASGLVLFKDGGEVAPVACARLVHRHFVFRWTALESTGACGITRTEKELKTVDDGYEIRQVWVLNLYFGALPAEHRSGD